jgi:hypothetical protein
MEKWIFLQFHLFDRMAFKKGIFRDSDHSILHLSIDEDTSLDGDIGPMEVYTVRAVITVTIINFTRSQWNP